MTSKELRGVGTGDRPPIEDGKEEALWEIALQLAELNEHLRWIEDKKNGC